MKKLIQKFLKSRGFQITKHPNKDDQRRLTVIKNLNINKILDVGANTGFFALNMRTFNYAGKIISFEPINEIFKNLEKNASKDKNWTALNYALGSADTSNTLNIAANTASSSILAMLPLHLKSDPLSGYVSTQEIQVKKLDTIFHEIYDETDQLMLKIDTQGYEKQVLEGAQKSLDKIKVIQLEMSIAPLYDGEMIMIDMIAYLNKLGFELFSLENEFADPVTCRLLQVDGLFVNKKFMA